MSLRPITGLAGILLAVLLTVASGCASSKHGGRMVAAPPVVSQQAAIADTALSYRNTDLTTAADLPPVGRSAAGPGESEPLPRSFENAPPLIPHAIDGLVPITTRENACLECHAPDVAPDVGATPVSPTHFYDLRRDRRLDTLNPAQYNCTQCHVAQHAAPSLIDNAFHPEFREARTRRYSDLMKRLHEGVR